MKRLVVLPILLLFLSGCRARVAKAPNNLVNSAELFEARHADLPFPVDSQIQIASSREDVNSNDVLVEELCTYKVAQSVETVCNFYRGEMERWGWQELLASGSADEYMFVFQKPGKRCVAIHILNDTQRKRSKSSRSTVSVFLQ
ncbi:TPA: hypothetical protein DCW54_00765 [Candidatus Dependentiae bacterium]|nr:hypothetical protein [Candidatus Dependentiae bacterium]